MTYLDISHNQLGGCKKRPVQYVICVGIYKSENHKYGIIRCIMKKKKIYIYMIPKYENCGSNH